MKAASRLGRRLPSNAEGMGFEPTTPCGAPDFESGRWPVRLPSGHSEFTLEGPLGQPPCVVQDAFHKGTLGRATGAARACGRRRTTAWRFPGPAGVARRRRHARQGRHWRHGAPGRLSGETLAGGPHRPASAAERIGLRTGGACAGSCGLNRCVDPRKMLAASAVGSPIP